MALWDWGPGASFGPVVSRANAATAPCITTLVLFQLTSYWVGGTASPTTFQVRFELTFITPRVPDFRPLYSSAPQ